MEVLCHAHKRGGQIQTLKKNLHILNIVFYRRPFLIQDSGNVYDGRYLATIFMLSCLWQPPLCDRKAERREIEYLHKRLIGL